MDIVSKVANAMQDILTTFADNIARKIGFIIRQRKITGSMFAQTLIFGWLDNPDATIDELTQTGVDVGLEISPQGLDKRFTQKASEFMYQLLEKALKVVIDTDPANIPILQRFNGVYLQDTSVVVLPDPLFKVWQGCGGSSQKNTSSSVKFHFRLDLNSGSLDGQLQSGREHDRSVKLEGELPTGSLWLADLGYFSLKDFSELSSRGVYHLSRVNSQCDLYTEDGKRWDLVEFLKEHCETELDMKVFLGVNERYPCRILAIRVPNAVAEVRRGKLKSEAKRKGRKVSERGLQLADWTILCANIPDELLSLLEALTLLRIRWQIEILFKLWKSEGHIDESRSEDCWRVLCELYAKLIGMLIQHWILLTGIWQHADRSILRSSRVVRKHATYLAIAFSSGIVEVICEALKVIQRCLLKCSGVDKRKTKPSAFQILLGLTDSA